MLVDDDVYAEIIEKRVHKGARVMDYFRPDWFRTINAGKLDVASPSWCVLGQTYAKQADENGVFSGYHYVAYDLMKRHYDALVTEKMREYGFFSTDLYSMDLMNQYWLEEIKRRRIKFSEGSPYRCDMCGNSYYTDSDINRHYSETNHGELDNVTQTSQA